MNDKIVSIPTGMFGLGQIYSRIHHHFITAMKKRRNLSSIKINLHLETIINMPSVTFGELIHLRRNVIEEQRE